MANARVHLLISGRVQGVFFRAFTEDMARSLGLKGWVRNTAGGDVEAEFEGEKKDIETAIGLCYQGPPASHVTGIDVKWEDYTGKFSGFSIKYF